MTGYVASPFWLIAKDDAGGVSIFTTTLARGERTLPVFSFEEEAGRFLALRAPGSGWRTRSVSALELGSVLRDTAASLSRIALDPPPEPDVGGLRYLASIYRETFLQLYLQEVAFPARRAGPCASRRASV